MTGGVAHTQEGKGGKVPRLEDEGSVTHRHKTLSPISPTTEPVLIHSRDYMKHLPTTEAQLIRSSCCVITEGPDCPVRIHRDKGERDLPEASNIILSLFLLTFVLGVHWMLAPQALLEGRLAQGGHPFSSRPARSQKEEASWMVSWTLVDHSLSLLALLELQIVSPTTYVWPGLVLPLMVDSPSCSQLEHLASGNPIGEEGSPLLHPRHIPGKPGSAVPTNH